MELEGLMLPNKAAASRCDSEWVCIFEVLRVVKFKERNQIVVIRECDLGIGYVTEDTKAQAEKQGIDWTSKRRMFVRQINDTT